ncbi:MAG: UDP-3-O-[3-hydroxymyristoyl] glucosamine N-acyltransferase [Myxococcota bacterium]|jgi:UDP-3-O-[3-hydroxymyristoyl] glucosamine N-acyltransferase
MARCSFLVWMVTGSVAFAADANQDGCQDEYAANGSCVDVDATVDASSTVGASASVFDGASVGPQVALAADVVVGSRASLAGRVAHSSNPIPVGANTVIGRGAQLGVDHVLGTDVTVGRAVIAGARLTIADSGSLGYAVRVGDDVTIGAGAVVGNLVALGDFTTLGDNAVLARSVTVADAPNSGGSTSVNGIVGPLVTIAVGARIEQGARVRKQADIGAGAAVESSGRIGREAIILAGATVFGRVGASATVGAGATVEAGAVVSRGGEVCTGATLPSGSRVASHGMWPVEGCLTSSTCEMIKANAPDSADGMYTMDPDGPGGLPAFDAYCDMTTDGGGWTLIYQVNALGCTQYDSEDIFETRATFGTLSNDNFLPSYFYTLPFTESYMVDEDHDVPVISTSVFPSGTIDDFLDTVDPAWPRVVLWTGGNRTFFDLRSGGTSDGRFSNGDLRGSFTLNQSDIPDLLSPQVSYTYAAGETHLMIDSAQGTGARRYGVALQPVAGVAIDQRYQLFVR